MKTALLGGAPSLEHVSCFAGWDMHIEVIAMLKNDHTPTNSRQPVSFDAAAARQQAPHSLEGLTADERWARVAGESWSRSLEEFARDVVEFFGAGHLVAVALYIMDGREHVEIAGPMPRGWQRMIPARGRHRGMLRLGWRNSRGKQLLHPIDFSKAAELAAELAEQRAVRRAA